MTLTINETARRNFEWVEAMGWHNTPPASATRLALIGSEIGEFANECRGDEPTEHAVEELADIVLRCLDVMVGLRCRCGHSKPYAVAQFIAAPGCKNLPDHVGSVICWTAAMRESTYALQNNMRVRMPGGMAGEGPAPLELAWGISRTLHNVAADPSDEVPRYYGTVIRATMYTAKMLGLPLDMAIVAKLERNEQKGNPKGRSI